MKAVELLTSSYIAHENIQMFERICKRVNPQNTELFDLETVKAFTYALNYMWQQHQPQVIGKTLASISEVEFVVNTE